MIFLLSIAPTFFTASCKSWPTAHASDELLSIWNLFPP